MKEKLIFGLTEAEIELEAIRQEEMNKAQDEYNEYLNLVNEGIYEQQHFREEEYNITKELDNYYKMERAGLI